eukprot:TRINITY_DN968_c0_g2_i6.p1 TRINITY_DN968_c0_g2~~TRINITY_DN968_c0_g2_i6.p1  ORF type:complete len:324 (+),score=60.73 TRINITY_DN968_c0_g2_i6:1256-2227(+)
MKRVLITGITEHLGSHVARMCVKRGYRIRGVASGKIAEQEQDALNGDVEMVENSPAVLQEAIKGCSHILHLTDHFPEKDEGGIKELDGILEGAAKHRVKRIIIKGSMHSLGVHTGGQDEVYDENSYCDINSLPPKFRAKPLLEQYALKRLQKMPKGLDLSFIHPGVIYGPLLRKQLNPNLEQVAKMLTKRLPYIRLCFPIVDVRDAAFAFASALDSPSLSKRYVCSGGSLWLNEMAGVIEDEFGQYGYRCKKVLGGRFVMKLAAKREESVKFLMQNEGVEFVVNSELAEKELGASFREPKGTVIDTVYSLIEMGAIPNRILKK